MKKVYIYAKYERFWHWTQAGLILLLALTGFEVHGSYQVMGYEAATVIHINATWALIGLTLLTWFWGFVTGEWQQFNPFVPSMRFMKQQIQYYMGGIFKGEEHPTHKTKYTKFNPLQRVTYLGLVVVIIPFMLFSGLAYLFHDAWGITNLGMLANAHVLGAFLLLAFVIGHIYLTTTGYKPLSSIKAMITGWEEMEDKEIKMVIEEGLKVHLEEQENEIDDKAVFDDALKSVENE